MQRQSREALQDMARVVATVVSVPAEHDYDLGIKE